jgi:UDP-GlcNAc:undecaprenyl-phosphate GlcNAc-1-phosphate transferase
MTTILVVFCCALVLSLVVTPLSGKLGRWGQAMDMPDGLRKIHLKATPRVGGIAIFVSFAVSLLCSHLLNPHFYMLKNDSFGYITAGVLVFGVGLWDDYHRLSHRVKFLVQVLAATMVYFCGDRIQIVSLIHWQFGAVVSYGVTVFWFLAFINAVNLIDGLDGLAAGVCFFCCTVMTILSILRKDYVSAGIFAALGGSLLGFLRYNFNPATIFLGDAGSYFLGFVIAEVSLNNSIKSQTSAAILIPVLALGVPLFDTILSPIRRFITGKSLFRPDRRHIHHKLLEKLGLDVRRAVGLIYIITAGLCVIALLIVNLQNFQAGFLLILIGACAMIFIRKLGYLDYLASDKILGWLQDIGDVSGFSGDRRSFLNLQIEISQSKDLSHFWQNVCNALEKLKFDCAVMILKNPVKSAATETAADASSRSIRTTFQENQGDAADEQPFSWIRSGVEIPVADCDPCLFKLELPLIDNCVHSSFGTLWLEKSIRQDAISHYTLRRVEHLRRSMIRFLENLERIHNNLPEAVPAPNSLNPVTGAL